jgi:hypothetical protein
MFINALSISVAHRASRCLTSLNIFNLRRLRRATSKQFRLNHCQSLLLASRRWREVRNCKLNSYLESRSLARPPRLFRNLTSACSTNANTNTHLGNNAFKHLINFTSRYPKIAIASVAKEILQTSTITSCRLQFHPVK